MIAKKKIVVLALALMSALIIGVYAGMQLSNNLTASWVVSSTGTELVLTWNPSPDGSTFNRGTWYGSYGVRLQNPGTATYNVIVNFVIDCNGVMPQNSITLQYYDGAVWQSLPFTTGAWGSSEVGGTFGPPSGFSVGLGYDVTTLLRIMFEGNATITNYATTIWVTQM